MEYNNKYDSLKTRNLAISYLADQAIWDEAEARFFESDIATQVSIYDYIFRKLIDCGREDTARVISERLIAAIKAAARGECRVSGSLVRTLFARASNPTDTMDQVDTERSVQPPVLPNGETLTNRETEVISCLLKGESNKEIARDLGLSPNTIRNQLQRLQERFGARNRVQLALLARDIGCV